MPSPFPGMDPYLEGPLWPDVHHALATEFRRRLAPQLRPKYVARLEIRFETDPNPEADDATRVLIPDVDVFTAAPGWSAGPPGAATATLSPETATVPVLPAEEVKRVTIEVVHRERGELVTAIETLSPVNKREPGLTRFREKRRELRSAGVNLLEIDLLRRGTRTVRHPSMPPGDYFVTLTPAGKVRARVWAATVREALPVVPVPLLEGDGAAALDLAASFAQVYDDADYDLELDYAAAPPPPEFSPDDRAWIAALLADRRGNKK